MIGELSRIFLSFLQKNMMVTVVIVAVLAVRLLLRKMPKKFSYLLWSIVGIRMIFDLPLASRFSVFNLFRMTAGHTSTAEVMLSSDTNALYESGTFPAQAHTQGAETILSGTGSAAFGDVWAPAPTQTVLGILGLLWIIGMILFVAYGVYSYAKCKMLVRTAVILNDVNMPYRKRMTKSSSVWECDCIPSPFVLGIIRPKIYIPFRMSEQEQTYILAHEQYHIRRHDPLWKLIAFVLLAVYWWNPFVWIAFFYMVRDMEMSCDEAVIEQFGSNIKKGYSNSLLTFALERHPCSFAPIAFGEGDAGRRIKNVLNFKKPHTWVALLVIVLIVMASVSCLTNQKNSNANHKNSQNTQDISSETIRNTEAEQPTEGETENTNSQTQSLSDVDVKSEINKWAEAFCKRDVRIIKEMTNQDAQDDLKRENLLDEHNFGDSSPWPWLDTESGVPGYLITSIKRESANILFYSQVSDPHVTVWEETLHYIIEDSKLLITQEELVYHDYISSGAEFISAYPKGVLNTPMDYWTNGWGEMLNEHAIASNGYDPTGRYQLTNPADAASCLLNLLNNENKVNVSIKQVTSSDDAAFVRIHFVLDNTDFVVKMTQPWSEEGIWVPADIVQK